MSKRDRPASSSGPPAEVEQRVDALYGLPREQFTKSRNELARELRSEDAREAADEVQALQKPSPAAWAVNQLVRTQQKDTRALLEAGDRLRKAHEAAAGGTGSAGDLRAAGDAERAAVTKLTRTARGLVTESGRGLSEGVLERVAETLHAMAVDPDRHSLGVAGRLAKESRVVGTGPVSPPTRTKGRAKPDGPSPSRIREMRQRLERMQREARDLRSTRIRAERATADAERRLAQARKDEQQAADRESAKEAQVEELRGKLKKLR
jgi:hypothetical protein